MTTTPSTQALVETLARMQREIDELKRGTRTPQLPHSALGPGQHIAIVDEEGRTAGRIGYQPDGGIGLVPDPGIGEPPARPSTPQVAGGPVGVIVVWDGRLVDDDGDLPLPSTFDHVSVHVHPGAVPGFEPTAATFQGTIPRAGGAFPVAPLPVGEVHTVRLVAVTTSGVEGEPSAPATGTPEAVGGVPEPGSITEVELADDSVTAPKVRAEAIQAWHIVAQAIETGHLAAQAVTAAKLAAEIVLASRLIAGNPAADRVEVDDNGLRGYDDQGALIFAISGGSAVFTGDITGSEISGSRFTMGSGSVTGSIEATGSVVTQRVQSGERQAQLVANATQANFTAISDASNPSSPLAGFAANDDSVSFVLDSSRTASDGLPSVTGTAFPTHAQLVLWSKRNDTDEPRQTFYATDSEAAGAWISASGSSVGVRAVSGWAELNATPAASTVGQPDATPGILYAFRRSGSDAPTLSLQSPVSVSGAGANRRALVHVEGANSNRAHTIINHAARIHYLQGELVSGSTDTTTDGRVELAPTHSILASRHVTEVGRFNDATPSGTTNGDFVEFTTGQWDRVTVKTGASGRVAVVIRVFGYSAQTSGSSLAIGWRTSNGAVEAHLDRAYYFVCGSTSYSQMLPVTEITTYATLAPNTQYTFIPCWRKSSGTWGSTVHMSNRLHGTAMLVTPLM